MIRAKEINILSETEVPYGTDTGFGTYYELDLNNYGNLQDVNELIEDDDYIVGTAMYGDTYSKNGYVHRYTRNNYSVDKAGNVYSGNQGSSVGFMGYDSSMPGYKIKTFGKDVLALVFNVIGDIPQIDHWVRYTGDAYCIKSITAIQGRGNLSIKMNAKTLGTDVYTDYDVCTLPSDEYNQCTFLPDSHSLLYVSNINDVLVNEAYSLIGTQGQLELWIRNIFDRLAASGASPTAIINYIEDQMPYGGILFEPWRAFYRGSAGNYYVQAHPIISRTLNPITNKYDFYPTGFMGKQWIIPFASEEEYHAAVCTKAVSYFPYT